MKTLLLQITLLGLHVGQWHLYAYDDGTITARQQGSGLMAPNQKANVAGLRRLLDWIDSENLKPLRHAHYDRC